MLPLETDEKSKHILNETSMTVTYIPGHSYNFRITAISMMKKLISSPFTALF